MLSFDRAILISDLHLCDTRPAINRAFFDFLKDIPPQTQALFILGDFFEYWVGDDAASEFHFTVAHRLKQLSERCAIYMMVGNRDFALGDDFAAQCGATLLSDPSTVRLAGRNWVLSHGDALCTDDIAYQRFRRVIRHPLVLGLLRRLPKSIRIRLAERLRDNSMNRHRDTANPYMDVTADAVVQLLAAQGVRGLIHGHTHMADWHEHTLPDGDIAERLVLGDWHHHGWCIRFDNERPALERFEIAEQPHNV